MPLSTLDAGGIARSLVPLAERSVDRVDAFFEVIEEVRLSPGYDPPDLARRREAGLAVRLLREGRSWLASTDAIGREALEEALQRVARSRPAARPSTPELACGPIPEAPIDDLLAFPGAVVEAIRERLAAFPVQLEVARHRRWVRVIGPVVAPDEQAEEFFSVRAVTRWGRIGGLLGRVDREQADGWADRLLGFFRSRDAAAPGKSSGAVVLGPGAAAVLLHEAVAHALESDAPFLGVPEDLPGLELAAPCLSVVDDPAAAPAGARRQSDDEGTPTGRRWLLRDGVVDQPLADLRAAAESTALVPGAGRRSSRHQRPAPRSSVLEMIAGDSPVEELLRQATGGLYFGEASRGSLDERSGRFELVLPFGRRIDADGLAEWVGACRLGGDLRQVLKGVRAVGDDLCWAGSGWCAKAGLRVPVWARAASLLLDDVEVTS